MTDPNCDPSIEHEPQWNSDFGPSDPAEGKAARHLAREAQRATIDDMVEHTVWDEPALSNELAGPPDTSRLTYAEWLDWRIATTSSIRTWYVTLLIVIAAGPWGVVGALFNSYAGSGWGLLAISVVAPVTEEMMKIAIALWVIEKRPYLFRMPFQILICALAGGLAFAFIENLMYLFVYIPKTLHVPGAGLSQAIPTKLVVWRWTVCTGLHATCSFFAGLGLVRMWSHTIAYRTRPQVAYAAPMIIAAMIGHGLYNSFVTIAELGGWLQF